MKERRGSERRTKGREEGEWKERNNRMRETYRRKRKGRKRRERKQEQEEKERKGGRASKKGE